MSYKNFTVEVDADGIALVTWDMPGKSMNVFNESVLEELDKVVDQVTADAAIKGAVITSGKDSFSGGADLTMMRRMLDLFEAEKSKGKEQAARFLFDNEGHLFYSIGERGHPEDAQDLSKPTGKVHRVNDDGSTPKDNPYVGKPGAVGGLAELGQNGREAVGVGVVR